jgi:hypothetical protein
MCCEQGACKFTRELETRVQHGSKMSTAYVRLRSVSMQDQHF